MHRGMALLLLLLQRMSPTLEGQPSGWGGVHSGPRASSRPFAPNGRASEAQRMCCLPARPAWLSLRLRGGSSGALAHGHDRAATRAQSRGRGSDPQDDVLDDERATQRARGAGGKRGDDEPPESAQDSSSGRIVGWEAVGAGVKDARELLGLPKKRNWAASDKHVKSKARRRDRNDEPPPAGAGDAAQGEGSAAEGRPDQETSDGGLDLDDSGGANAAEEVLDVDWDPAQEDPYLPPDAAGRRVITEELVQRLIADAGLPLQIETQFDEDPDPLERFNDRPKVFLVGPAHAAQKLSSRLPRGFGVERLNATLSILGRAPSPPPLGRDDSDQDRYRGPLAEEQERWLDSDGAEGTTLDEAYAAGNTTLREYREAMVPRLLKLRRRSEVNDGNGAYELGMRLLYGIGVRKDPMNGCRYVMNAAAQGHCYAQAQLGCCYHEGVGIARDDGKAAKWWKLAATGNSIIPEGVLLAMHNLAVAYAQGIGVKRDYLLACHWHKQAAKSGDRDSQFNLAYYYTMGKGVRRHLRKAAYWLLEAAKQEMPEAGLELAARYWRGEGVPRDAVKASYWLRKAARMLPEAQKVLEALESGGNAKEVDALFPPPISPRHVEDNEMVQAHQNLQREISSQLERARLRAAAAQDRRAREDLVEGTRIGRRLEEALGEASLAALHSVAAKERPLAARPPPAVIINKNK